MAKLSTKQRKKLPPSDFAGPNKSYPVPDKAHARNALARAAQQVAAGNLSKSEQAKIDAKANKVLHPNGDPKHKKDGKMSNGNKKPGY